MTRKQRSIFPKRLRLLLCKCYFVLHPGPKSTLVSVCESSDAAPQPLPLCLHVFASIFQPLSSKQPQTPQLLINSPYLQNRHVSQHPICHLLDRSSRVDTPAHMCVMSTSVLRKCGMHVLSILLCICICHHVRTHRYVETQDEPPSV